MSVRAACGVALALLAAPLCAQVNSPERLAAWARLPDWSGQWEMGPPPGGPPPAGGPSVVGNLPVRGPGLDVPLPFNPAWQAKYDAYRQSLAAIGESDAAPDTTVTECIWGLPRMQLGPALFEITVTPEETMIDFDPREVRHIYTDGRAHPVHLQPSAMGHSIGHWEGQTLVADTVGLRDDIWVNAAAAMLSRQARVTERWSLLDSGKLQDEIAVYDPLAFKPGAAWKMTRSFRRVTDTNRLVEQNCMENSHDVLDGGAVTTIFKATPKQGKAK